jgi:hypothetical protein
LLSNKYPVVGRLSRKYKPNPPILLFWKGLMGVKDDFFSGVFFS